VSGLETTDSTPAPVEQSTDTSNRPTTPRKGGSRVLPGERPGPSQVGQEAALPPVAAPPVSGWRAESEYLAPELAKSLLVPDADGRLPLRWFHGTADWSS
jgi:hypothetical protein